MHYRRPNRPRHNAAMGGTMSDDPDRRAFVLGFVATALAAVLRPGAAAATGGAVRDQPWAVWDKNDKPVRGGVYRLAAEQYIGKMNPNHWPVLDWVSMGYFHERLMFTDGQDNPTIPWLAEEAKLEDPQTVVMRLREGATVHARPKFHPASVKHELDRIREPEG